MYMYYTFFLTNSPRFPFFPSENNSPSLPLPLAANSHSHEPKLDLSFSLCWCSAAETQWRVSSRQEIVSLGRFNLIPMACSQSIQRIHEKKKPPAFQCVILKTWNGVENLSQPRLLVCVHVYVYETVSDSHVNFLSLCSFSYRRYKAKYFHVYNFLFVSCFLD